MWLSAVCCVACYWPSLVVSFLCGFAALLLHLCAPSHRERQQMFDAQMYPPHSASTNFKLELGCSIQFVSHDSSEGLSW